MLRAVIKKELLGHLASFRFLISTFIMLVLAALAASVGTRDYDLRRSHYQARLAKHAEAQKRVPVYSQLQPKVARAPEPLSVLHRGFDARLGIEVQLDVFSIPTAAETITGDQGGVSSRDLDLTTIVRVVLGLLALLLTFDAVVGERESHTLRLVFANAISRSTLMAGKYIGACLALLAPLLAGVAVSLWILLGQGRVVLEADRWQRLLGLLLAYAFYLSLMVMLGLVLSSLARTRAGALVYSLLAWLAIVFLIPQSALAVAGVVEARSTGSPADLSLAELIAERDQALSQLLQEASAWPISKLDWAPVQDETRARGVRYRFGSAAVYDLWVDLHARETALGMAYADRVFELERRVDERRRRIESLARTLASLSPAFLMERIAASYAGTSVDDYDSFLDDCRRLRRHFIDYLEQRGAFTSWRWFTDDSPLNLEPWPEFMGVVTETTDAAVIEELVQRWSTGENQRRVEQAKQAHDADPARWLPARDMPTLLRNSPDVWQAGRRVVADFLWLLLLNGALAGAVRWRFAGYSPC